MQPLADLALFNEKPIFTQSASINLDWLENLPLEETSGIGKIISTTVTSINLKSTSLSCPTCTVPGKWENRLLFIKKIVLDVIMNCPKNEPLALISLGSGELLMEYIIGKALIENGFRELSFFLIDPQYAFYEPNAQQKTENILTDFRQLINTIYSNNWDISMPKDGIRYLSRAPNISKYPLDHANVVLIECLPPYGECIKALKRDKIGERKPEECFMGSNFIPPEYANTIAFLPHVCEEQYLKTGVTFAPFSSLPYIAFQQNTSKPKYCIEWGCKIYTDGSFFVRFFGAEGFCSSLPYSPTQNLQLRNGKTVIFSQWFPTIQQNLENYLKDEISTLQQGNPQKKLSQNEKTALLNKVKEVFDKHFIGAKVFYIADYSVDRRDMINFLETHAGYHYRKAFALFSNAENSCAITEQVI